MDQGCVRRTDSAASNLGEARVREENVDGEEATSTQHGSLRLEEGEYDDNQKYATRGVLSIEKLQLWPHFRRILRCRRALAILQYMTPYASLFCKMKN